MGGLTNVTINDWRRLEDTLWAWEWIAPVGIRKSEHKNEAEDEDPSETRPDKGRYFPFRGRRWTLWFVIEKNLRTQEWALLAWGLYSSLCVAGGHGIG